MITISYQPHVDDDKLRDCCLQVTGVMITISYQLHVDEDAVEIVAYR